MLAGPDFDEQVARIVHELRSPLAATMQAVELISRTPDQPPDPELLAIARRQLGSGLRRVERLLLLLSGERASETESPQRHDLRALVEDVVAAQPPADAGVGVEVEVEQGIDIVVDRRAFEHVLDNLLANATRHAPADTAVLIGATSRTAEVWLTVADQGPGIEPDLLPTVFEPFVRGSDGGAGLGLAIVRQLAEAQGGRVWVDHSTSQGTRVVVALPRA